MLAADDCALQEILLGMTMTYGLSCCLSTGLAQTGLSRHSGRTLNSCSARSAKQQLHS